MMFSSCLWGGRCCLVCSRAFRSCVLIIRHGPIGMDDRGARDLGDTLQVHADAAEQTAAAGQDDTVHPCHRWHPTTTLARAVPLLLGLDGRPKRQPGSPDRPDLYL